MSAAGPEQRAADLRKELAEHNRRYYVLDDPTHRRRRLRRADRRAARDRGAATRAAHARTRRRSGSARPPLERFEQVEHPEPMLSLANARNEDELRAWETRIRDTSSASTSTRREFATRPSRRSTASPSRSPTRTASSSAAPPAATAASARTSRQNLRTIRSIPLRIAATRRRWSRCAARSTCRSPPSSALNERRAEAGEPAFANPRNSAAGSIRQLDPTARRRTALSALVYGIGAAEGLDPATHSEELEWLRERGFKVNPDISRHHEHRRRGQSAATGGRSGATSSTTRSTASSSRSTSGRSGASSASSAASRAGRSPRSSRRPRRRRSC